MRDCKHLVAAPPKQLPPGKWSRAVAECKLKVDGPTRVELASAAATHLDTVCPPTPPATTTIQ
jgi:hypothetical protein